MYVLFLRGHPDPWILIGHCGSEPARDSGGSVAIDAGCASLIASRLAPTGSCVGHKIRDHHCDYCGSGLARDGGVPVANDVGCACLIASRLAPTGTGDEHKIQKHHKSLVGVSLLAMAVCQSPLMLDVPASSRAGSLLQGFVSGTESGDIICPRWRCVRRSRRCRAART